MLIDHEKRRDEEKTRKNLRALLFFVVDSQRRSV
jgi:hypothetical protein